MQLFDFQQQLGDSFLVVDDEQNFLLAFLDSKQQSLAIASPRELELLRLRIGQLTDGVNDLKFILEKIVEPPAGGAARRHEQTGAFHVPVEVERQEDAVEDPPQRNPFHFQRHRQVDRNCRGSKRRLVDSNEQVVEFGEILHCVREG
jgi:hypothetical protein